MPDNIVFVVIGTAYSSIGVTVTVLSVCDSEDRAKAFVASLKALHPNNVYAVQALALIEG